MVQRRLDFFDGMLYNSDIAEESRTHKPLGVTFLQLLPRRGL